MSDSEFFEEYGNYSIQYKIGSGSFGNVYKGVDIDTKQEVALKVSISSLNFR
jgi:serine/threonine protein kinase